MVPCKILSEEAENDEGGFDQVWEDGFYLGMSNVPEYYDGTVFLKTYLLCCLKSDGHILNVPVGGVKLIIDGTELHKT